jgi:hypothetical protein
VPCAVPEVWVAHTGIEERLASLLDPCPVVEIVGIELLEQKLVPGVTALVQRFGGLCLALCLELSLWLALLSTLRLRLLLRQGGAEDNQP